MENNNEIYTITWEDVENMEIEYENYLNDIESFFTEDFDDEDEENEIKIIEDNETTKN